MFGDAGGNCARNHYISDAQAVSLKKFLDIVVGIHNDLVTGTQTIGEGNLRDFVVTATLKKINVFLLQLQEYTAVIELSLETKVGDFKEMRGTVAKVGSS